MKQSILEIQPLKSPLNASLSIPGSKSYTNRAFLIAALAKGQSLIKNPLLSDDTKYMISALKKLGIKIKRQGKNYLIHGQNGKFPFFVRQRRHGQLTVPTTPLSLIPYPLSLFLGNAGTAVRFLTAAAALQNFSIKITGNKRMRERPLDDLIDGLTQLGAKIYSQKNNGCPPVIIEKPMIGGTCRIHGNKSSQFFSALLLACPLLKKDTTIEVIGDLVSKPYIDQTLDIMKTFGVNVKNQNYKKFIIKGNQHYKSHQYEVEADASSATYFAAIAALTGSQITIENLKSNSKQADIHFLEILKKMGAFVGTRRRLVPTGITITGPQTLKPLGQINLNHMPDGAMTVAILCAFAKGQSILTGLHNLRLKETDRLKALVTELKKIGCDVKETDDGLIINGNPNKLHGATIETYDDHRMAMCFAVAGTKIPGLKIKNPNCVKKTYPNFWKDLKKIGVKFY